MESRRSREDLVVVEGSRGSAGCLWLRRTTLEKVLMGVSIVAVLACIALIGVVAVRGSGTAMPPDTQTGIRCAPAQVQLDVPPQDTGDHGRVHSGKDLQNAKNLTPTLKMSTQLPRYYARTEEGVEYDICNTPECILAAAAIIEAMDKTIDPCQDFYQFACGAWMEKHPVPEESSRWSQFDILDLELSNALSSILTEPMNPQDPGPINQSKNFYAACVDEELLETIGVTPLTNFLSEFGGWPMTLIDWDENSFDWQFSVAEAKRQLGADYLVNVWVFADQKNTDQTAIYIDQTSLGMSRSVLTTPHNYEERINAYKTYIYTTASIIATSLGEDPSNIDAEVLGVVDFEMALANITTPAEDRRDINLMYNPMTVSELSELNVGSDIHWEQILSTMFASTGIPIDGSTRVVVQEPEYLKKLTALVATTSPRTVSNYIMWRHVQALGDETNLAMRDVSFNYDMVATGVTAQEPRWKVCADKSNNFMGLAAGTKYVETYFSQQAKDEANEMVDDIRSAFKDLLAVNKWMDEDTKPKAVEKADTVSKFIAYPEWYGNTTALDTYYRGLQDIADDNHFVNTQKLLLWMSTEELRDLGHPTKRNKWLSPPTIVNAYYLPEFNSITLPAGIFQPPFYRANSLQALNYGGIGQVIGHELTHGFDDEGRQNDKDGNAIPWWSYDTLAAFQVRAQCIVDQYDNIRVPELDDLLPNTTLNGVNTQGENIADNGGLREALLAYQKYIERSGEEPRLPGLTNYTPFQLFFLANANIWCGAITTEGLLNQVLTDSHSPARYRVLVPMSNMKEFSSIWGCPADSGMNPPHKCVVW
ncbi:neprilysin-1-like isoform X2 [Homarus americanus]|uniref:Neprilysin-11-like 1 n=2 Tax=Homarus americanus TaxID=6706 RepID=A0A8J5MNP7_HOMAM|nr:neprilysin-1-like isoform X2 [Homarus americanus]XP_042241538.1 neprilysin-1-like isoform X2 [Homarus americanus]KAG7158196.1 Neprilysin-11-like 1 [Homarus americanus]